MSGVAKNDTINLKIICTNNCIRYHLSYLFFRGCAFLYSQAVLQGVCVCVCVCVHSFKIFNCIKTWVITFMYVLLQQNFDVPNFLKCKIKGLQNFQGNPTTTMLHNIWHYSLFLMQYAWVHWHYVTKSKQARKNSQHVAHMWVWTDRNKHHFLRIQFNYQR